MYLIMSRKIITHPSVTEKWWGYFFAVAILCIVILTFAIADSKDLPLTIIGAVLGVAMTVFATYFLFKGQSNQQLAMLQEQHHIESMQEKESEVFKQKLATYNRFLDALRKYVTESTPSNKKEVIFHAMAIRMHSKPEVTEALDDNIINLIESTGSEKEVETLVESLNSIACIFGKELYGESTGSIKNLNAFTEAISGGQEEPSENERLIEVAEEEKEDKAAMQESLMISWDDQIKSLKAHGWNYTPASDSFKLTSDSSPVVISVYRKKGKYVVEASKEGDNAFSQNLKDSFKGSRRYGIWWRELPINNYGVKEGTLIAQLPDNDRARASVIKWIDKLTGYINDNQLK